VRLESGGVGRHTVRQSLVVLQAMYEQAIRWGWVPTNPVKAVKKPRRSESARSCAWRPPRSRLSGQGYSRAGSSTRRRWFRWWPSRKCLQTRRIAPGGFEPPTSRL
jgi:hypothetical protein